VEARMALYHQIEQMIIDETPDILLDHGQNYMLFKPHVHDYWINPMGTLPLTWRLVSIERSAE
jgi:hypothetical protein